MHVAPARSRSTGSGSATNANILRLLKQLTSLQRWRASGRGETELGLGAQHRHRTTLTGPGDARTPRQGLTDLPRASGRERVGGGGGRDNPLTQEPATETDLRGHPGSQRSRGGGPRRWNGRHRLWLPLPETWGPAEGPSAGSQRRELGGARGGQAGLREVARVREMAPPLWAGCSINWCPARAARDRRAGLQAYAWRPWAPPPPGTPRPRPLPSSLDHRRGFQASPTSVLRAEAWCSCHHTTTQKCTWHLGAVAGRGSPPGRSTCFFGLMFWKFANTSPAARIFSFLL